MDLIDAGALLKTPQNIDKICQILLIFEKSQAFKDLSYAVLKVTGYNKGNDINHRGRIQIRKKGSYGPLTKDFVKLIRWFVIEMKVGSLFFPFILPHRPGWQTSFPPIRLEWHAGKAQKERIFAGIALLFEYLCHCYSEVDTSGSIELLISWPAINTPCEKCGSGEFEDGNTIVYCSQCDIGYHQSCHRISVLPAAKEPWYCRDCQALKEFYTRLHADPQEPKIEANKFSESNNVIGNHTEDTIVADVRLAKTSDERRIRDEKLNCNKEHIGRFIEDVVETNNVKIPHRTPVKKRDGSPSQNTKSKKSCNDSLYTLPGAYLAPSMASLASDTQYALRVSSEDTSASSGQSSILLPHSASPSTSATQSTLSASFKLLEDTNQSTPGHQHTISNGVSARMPQAEENTILNVPLRPLIYMPLSVLEQSNTYLMTILNNRRKIKRAVDLSAINNVQDLYRMCAERWNVGEDRLSNIFVDLGDEDGSLLEIVKDIKSDFKAFIDWIKGKRNPMDELSKLSIHVELLELGYELE